MALSQCANANSSAKPHRNDCHCSPNQLYRLCPHNCTCIFHASLFTFSTVGTRTPIKAGVFSFCAQVCCFCNLCCHCQANDLVMSVHHCGGISCRVFSISAHMWGRPENCVACFVHHDKVAKVAEPAIFQYSPCIDEQSIILDIHRSLLIFSRGWRVNIEF